jgi:YkoY family integral membrane protein
MLFSWTELPQALGSVATLALLEAVLCADNAVALAGLVQPLQPAEERQRVLNLGLLVAYLLRGAMILGASWLIRYDALRALGGAYLIWLPLQHFQQQLNPDSDDSSTGPTQRPSQRRLGLPLIVVIALTDLAFSLDSISASVAITDNLALVLLGGAMGVVMLRFLANLVIAWMDRFPQLANAAYLTVLAVGLRMLTKLTLPALVPSEPVLLGLMLVLLAWGFSQQQPLRS